MSDISIQYIANMRFPTEKAHGAQIAKTCEAFVAQGAALELVVPNRRTDIAEDPFFYYALKKRFPVKRLFVIDAIQLGWFGFWIESATFALSAFVYALPFRGAIYSRDELPLLLLRLVGKRVVWESHTGRRNLLVRALLFLGADLVVISEGLKDVYKGFYKKEIYVVPDSIDTASFVDAESKDSARARLGLSPEAKVALYVGRLDGWKGVDTLCMAAEHMPPVTVAIVGGEKSQVEALGQRYPAVHFLGPRPYRELADNLAAADVLVLPNTGKDEISSRFTSPMKLFAYMAAGKPIVASDLPSIREVVNEESAFLFTPDDPKSLAEATVRAVTESEEAARRASHAKELAQKYSWEARAGTILGFIATI